MSKMSKAIAVLGVVAGLGVAALPLSSYAADEPTNYSQSAQAQVKVEVGGAISISTDAADGVVDLGQMKINGVSDTKDLNVTVSSNSEIGYDLTIKSATSETALVTPSGAKIPADANIAAGTSAWAYRLAGETEGTYGDWTAITASPVNILSHTADAANTGAMTGTTKVNFGASASGTQQEGIYTGTVVFTATVK